MSPRIRPRLVLAALGALALATGTQLATAGAAGASQAHAGASQTPAVSRACPVDLTPGHESCMVLKRTDVTPQVQPASAPKGIPAGYGYGPAQLQAAYNLAAAATADGKNSTVAVVDAYDDPTAASDLAVYRTAAGLPAANLTKVNQNGKASPLPKEAPADDDWTLEESLDLDMVSAICPNCKIIAVEAIPHTRTGKKLEVPIKRIFLGADPACVVSRDAVDDPAALDHFIALAAERAAKKIHDSPR